MMTAAMPTIQLSTLTANFITSLIPVVPVSWQVPSGVVAPDVMLTPWHTDVLAVSPEVLTDWAWAWATKKVNGSAKPTIMAPLRRRSFRIRFIVLQTPYCKF